MKKFDFLIIAVIVIFSSLILFAFFAKSSGNGHVSEFYGNFVRYEDGLYWSGFYISRDSEGTFLLIKNFNANKLKASVDKDMERGISVRVGGRMVANCPLGNILVLSYPDYKVIKDGEWSDKVAEYVRGRHDKKLLDLID